MPRTNFVLLASLLVAACSTEVDLRPTLTVARDTVPYARTVGFSLRSLAQTAEQEAAPYGQGHIAKFKIGPASADLFRSLIPRLFAEAVEVDGRPPLVGEGRDLSAVIEPKIDSFHFRSLRVGEWRYWADVTYRFDVYASDGTVTTSWKTRGEGEAVGMSHGESGTWAKAVEDAMVVAAKRFSAGFETVPEAKRWLIGLEPGGGSVAADLQQTRPFEEGETRGTVGAYDGVVRVRIELDPPEFRALTKKLPEGKIAGVMAIKITAENLGGRSLLIPASRVRLMTTKRRTVHLLPTTAAAALLTQQQMRVGPVAPGVGAAALPGLFAGLANLAARESEMSEYRHYMAALQDRAFEDAQLPPGAKKEKLALFPAPPSRAALRGVDLIVPVVDTERAMRYDVRLPVGERPPTFKPYVVEPDASSAPGPR